MAGVYACGVGFGTACGVGFAFGLGAGFGLAFGLTFGVSSSLVIGGVSLALKYSLRALALNHSGRTSVPSHLSLGRIGGRLRRRPSPKSFLLH